MVAAIILLLFFVDGFTSADARFIPSYNGAVINECSLLSMNPKGNGDALLGNEVVGNNRLARVHCRAGLEIVNKAKNSSPHENYEHSTATKSAAPCPPDSDYDPPNCSEP